MKKPLVLTLIICYFSGNVFAQENNWTVYINPDDELKNIIETILSRQNILIAYPPELSHLKPKIQGRVDAFTLDKLLLQIFPDQLEIKQLDGEKFLLRDKTVTVANYRTAEEIKGKVIDFNGQGIADVLVFQDGEEPVLTDPNGNFTTTIRPGKEQELIHFQSLGYTGISLSPSAIIDQPVISIGSKPYQLETINVVERLPAVRTKSDQSNIVILNRAGQHIGFTPLYSSDLIKQLQMLPGIQADDDLSAQIKIRGSDGNESLILLDGIPVYRTDHFYGIFSATNGNYFSEGSLYKNALPAQYGGRTGGLLAMNSAHSLNQWKGSAEIDLLTASLSLFTPISKTVKWHLGFRTSYINTAELNSFDLTQPNSDFYQNSFRPISRSETISTSPHFNFQDLNSKISITPSESLKLDLNFFGSSDQLKNNYDILYSSQIRRETATSTEIYRNQEDWNNLGASLNLQWQLNNHWQLHSSTYYTSYKSASDLRSSLTIDLPNQEISSGFSNIQNGEISSQGSHLYLQNKTDNQEVKFGLDYKSSQTGYHFTEDDIVLLDGKEEATQFAGFGEKVWRKNKNTIFTLGGRATYYSLTDQFYLDPKVQINHRTSEYFNLKTSIHFAHQFTRELNYENRLGQSASYLLMADGKTYPVGTSLQYMVGFDYKNSSWVLDVEFYQKNLNGVLEYSLQMPGFDPNLGFNRSRSYRIINGQGKVIGMDVLLSKSIKNYQGWIAYTLSKSTRQFKEIRKNVPFPAENDRRHQLKIVNSYNLGNFTFSANYIFSSGKPYLALNELPGEIDRKKLEPKTYLKTLPNYQRLDLGVDYHFNLLKNKGTIGISCFNVTNHNNVKYLQYIFSVPVDNNSGRQLNTVVGTETSLLGRTPNFRFRFDF